MGSGLRAEGEGRGLQGRSQEGVGGQSKIKAGRRGGAAVVTPLLSGGVSKQTTTKQGCWSHTLCSWQGMPGVEGHGGGAAALVDTFVDVNACMKPVLYMTKAKTIHTSRQLCLAGSNIHDANAGTLFMQCIVTTLH